MCQLLEKGEDTADDEMTENSDVREKGGDWGRKGTSSRREKRESERANWNSGGQVGLSGFEQDHWGGEMGSWYQDQWWDSGTWREESEAKRIRWHGETLERIERKTPE